MYILTAPPGKGGLMKQREGLKDYPLGWLQGINPVLDRFISEVKSRRNVDTYDRVVTHMRTFMRFREGCNHEPYEITEEYILLHSVALEIHLEKSWKFLH